MARNVIDGPIPGANFTADTKNFPWHRPPEHKNLDDAIEAVMARLFDDEHSMNFITMLEMGVTVTQLTDMIVTSGIGAGKWTPDFAVLMAGPVSHLIVILAKGRDIDYEMGYEKEDDSPTSIGMKFLASFDKSRVERTREQTIGNDPADDYYSMVSGETPSSASSEEAPSSASGASGGLAQPPAPTERPPMPGEGSEGMI